MTKAQNFQAEKSWVRAMHRDLISAQNDTAQVLNRYCAQDYVWHGFHPFNHLNTPEGVATLFWDPLHQSLNHLQQREDIFFAGKNQMDNFSSTWVVSMGHLMGLFDHPWLGIAPTGKMMFLRYCAFHKVADNRIEETAMYIDIPHFMMQAGLRPFPPQTAAHCVHPGPMTHDGILADVMPMDTGQKTLDLINAMIGDLGQWDSKLSLQDELRQTWAEDMIWWGPAGIGSTYTIERYARQHSGPFRAGFKNRSKTRHIARLAEGDYGGFFGSPNFTAQPTGGFMGMPATGQSGEFRVIDIYRRAGDKLAENWVFIDLLHFWKCQGVDILARMTLE